MQAGNTFSKLLAELLGKREDTPSWSEVNKQVPWWTINWMCCCVPLTLQIFLWEQNLEQFHMDLFRFRCYLASLQGGELPNPKRLLAFASRPTKLAMGRLGIFSVSSFHALVNIMLSFNSSCFYEASSSYAFIHYGCFRYFYIFMHLVGAFTNMTWNQWIFQGPMSHSSWLL